MAIHRPVPRPSPGSSRLVLTGMVMTGVSLVAAALVPEASAHVDVTVPQASAGTTTCEGSQTVAYSPGMSLKPRHVTIHGTATLSHCASSADPTITGGRSTFHATGQFSCVSGDATGVRTITWNNGRSSTMSFTSSVSVNAGESVVAVRGTVTDGEFDGQKWSAVSTMFASRPAACATPEGVPTTYARLLLTVGSLIPGRSALDRSQPTPR
ncbi:hypothetical protein GCM10027176_84250 [Actinoallomurus bryophytorum]|uniref:Uncharacterized protein n=1 Tax=Actinoallomurus bryophytorum TaxID=1490222 RepID=A0A543CTF3_9ACTN|nr:hypothetical protein [Actinoallomurus bryophytorum]TQM00319.1 hypothetical protein FB559_6030 [Actinoallomurus bryophytorum]